MAAELISFRSIGRIESPFQSPEEMPIQSKGADGIFGKIILLPEFEDGLKDLDGFSHIILLYHWHLSDGYSLHVKPFLDTVERGLFSTRAPRRPNPIGISVVRLHGIEGNILHIEGVDVINGTPLLDIKPYIPAVDTVEADRAGWVSGNEDSFRTRKSDNRFV